MKLLLLDNFDSFTYNLYHYLEPLCANIVVARNNEFSLDAVNDFTHILISPGPGLPQAAGITNALIATYGMHRSILGVCLGAQALAQQFGAELYNQNEVAHGISRTVNKIQEGWLLNDMPQQFKVGLYHSWAINSTKAFADEFTATATRDNGTLMAFEHKTKPLAGVQFHPESVMSEGGKLILKNWLNRDRSQSE